MLGPRGPVHLIQEGIVLRERRRYLNLLVQEREAHN